MLRARVNDGEHVTASVHARACVIAREHYVACVTVIKGRELTE